MVVVRVHGGAWRRDVGQRVQTLSYKMNNSEDLMYSMETIVNNNVLYT